MQNENEAFNEAALVKLDGEYDLGRKEELRQLFESCNAYAPLVIDLSNVSFIDSSALNELMRLRNQNTDRSLALTGVSEQIRRILQIANVDRLFDVFD